MEDEEGDTELADQAPPVLPREISDWDLQPPWLSASNLSLLQMGNEADREETKKIRKEKTD